MVYKHLGKIYLILVILLFAVSLLMLTFYFSNFNDGFSGESNDWGNFGSYLSPITNVITISILILTLYIQRNENIQNKKIIEKQHNEHIDALKEQINHSEERLSILKIEKEIELYTNYLSAMNKYLLDINDICMNIMRINRLYQMFKGETAGKEDNRYIKRDFLDQIKIVNILKNDIIDFFDNKIMKYNEKRYYERFMRSCDELLDYDLFINITEEMQKNTVGYVFFLNEKYEKRYNEIVLKIMNSTKENMGEFSVFDFKIFVEESNNMIIKHISNLRQIINK